MKIFVSLVITALICILCLATAGCITATDPDANSGSGAISTAQPTGTPVILEPGPVVRVVPGEWEGVLTRSDGTQVKYSIDCEQDGSAKIEIDQRMGVMDDERTYYGTWSAISETSYVLDFSSAGSYTLTLENSGTATLKTPDGDSVVMNPDNEQAKALVAPKAEPVIGDWKGTVRQADNTQTEYELDLKAGGSAEIAVETTAPLSYEKEAKYYGSWTKTTENVYSIQASGTPGYTMTLTGAGTATLRLSDSSEVPLIRDY